MHLVRDKRVLRRHRYPAVARRERSYKEASVRALLRRFESDIPLQWLAESAGQSRRAQAHRGKSGLHRARCQV